MQIYIGKGPLAISIPTDNRDLTIMHLQQMPGTILVHLINRTWTTSTRPVMVSQRITGDKIRYNHKINTKVTRKVRHNPKTNHRDKPKTNKDNHKVNKEDKQKVHQREVNQIDLRDRQ